MTYPHIDPEFKVIKHPEGVEIEEQANKVFGVCNKVIKVWLNCPDKKQECSKCGNAECLEALTDFFNLQGMTLEEGFEKIKNQTQKNNWACIAQKKRFERYKEINNRFKLDKDKAA